MTRRLSLLLHGSLLLAALAVLHAAYALGETALCYSHARHVPELLHEGRGSLWGYCVGLHLFYPFTF